MMDMPDASPTRTSTRTRDSSLPRQRPVDVKSILKACPMTEEEAIMIFAASLRAQGQRSETLIVILSFDRAPRGRG